MTKRDKRLQKIHINKKTVSFETLDLILDAKGFERRQPKSGSSHYTYVKDDLLITVPYKQPYVKEIYVKRVLEIIGEKS